MKHETWKVGDETMLPRACPECNSVGTGRFMRDHIVDVHGLDAYKALLSPEAALKLTETMRDIENALNAIVEDSLTKPIREHVDSDRNRVLIRTVMQREVDRMNTMPLEEKIRLAVLIGSGTMYETLPTAGIDDVSFSIGEEGPTHLVCSLKMTQPLERVQITFTVAEDEGA